MLMYSVHIIMGVLNVTEYHFPPPTNCMHGEPRVLPNLGTLGGYNIRGVGLVELTDSTVAGQPRRI